MPKRFSFRILSIVLLATVFVGQGCTKAPDAATQAASKRAELNIWGEVDDVDVYESILKIGRAHV